MKINYAWLIIPVLLLLLKVDLAQGQIRGSVYDIDDSPIEFANVLVIKYRDSSLVKAQLSDPGGGFAFEGISADSLRVVISHLSYNTWESSLLVRADLPLDLGKIKLDRSENALGEVTITAEKPFMEMRPDKLVVNINKDGQFLGNSAFEIMEKLPGLSVDFLSGRINIQGKQGSTVLINGRATNLSPEDIAVLLRSTTSEEIEQVEIITNPSAKYDAAGTAGVINIILRKNEKEGLNGSARANIQQGIYFKYGTGLSLNYRRKKWNVYGSYNIQDRKDFTNITYDQSFGQAESVLISRQESNRIFNVVPQNFSLGIDFNATDNLDINFLFNGAATNFNSPQKNLTTFSNLQGDVESSAFTRSMVDNLNNNYSFNLNVVKVNDDKSSRLSLNLDYTLYDRDNDQFFTTEFFDENGSPTGELNQLRIEIPSNIDIWSVQGDYSKTFENNSAIEVGGKWSNVVNDNFPKFFNVDQGTETLDTDLTNHFVYDETISALYADYSKEFTGSSLKVGLRMENTVGIGDQKITNERFKRTYLEFFPTVFFQTDISENHAMSFAYGRRIDRPSYNDLNPYRLFLDQFSLWEGNPMLGPQFTSNFEVSHQYKRNLVSKLSYTRTRDVISDIILQNDDTQVTTQTKRNLNTFSQLNLSLSASFKPFDWWNSNASGSIFNNQYEGVYLEEDFELDRLGFLISNNNTFKISPQINANLNLRYNSEALTGIEESLSSYSISTGVTRTSEDKRTSIRVSISDIFYGRRGGGVTLINSLDRRSLVRFDSRVLRLSFTYNFGKNTVPRAKRRRSAIDEEKNRTF